MNKIRKQEKVMLKDSLTAAGMKDMKKSQLKDEDKKRELLVKSIIKNAEEPTYRLCVGIPLTGLVRVEWMMARYGQVIPTNWSQVDAYQFVDQWSPLRHTVADARNIIATMAVEKEFEWLLFIDHDTIIPPNTFTKINETILEEKIPVWSGLYFTKSIPAEPLLYRGRGNSFYNKWKLGDRVWVDGIPMGCTLIHVSLLKVMYEESEEYHIGTGRVRRIFETPKKMWFDPQTMNWNTQSGTEDIWWCNRVITKRIFDKAGWPAYQEKRYPFMVDTSIFCRHIDQNGIQYPAVGEEWDYIPDNIKKELNLRDD